METFLNQNNIIVFIAKQVYSQLVHIEKLLYGVTLNHALLSQLQLTLFFGTETTVGRVETTQSCLQCADKNSNKITIF